jgi:DNA-binding LacI/PurR family transcriptional regulator
VVRRMTDFSSNEYSVVGQMPGQFSLGGVLRRLGIPRAALAGYLGVSVQTINNWCAGRIQMPVQRLAQVGAFLQQNGASATQVEAMVSESLAGFGLERLQLTPRAGNPDARPGVMTLCWDLTRADFSPFPHVARQTRASLERSGFTSMLIDCEGSLALCRRYLNWAAESGCPAVVLVGMVPQSSDPKHELFSCIEAASKAGVFVVLVHSGVDCSSLPASTAAIGWDHRAADGLAIEALVRAGHQSIGFIVPSRASLVMGIHSGIPDALNAHGLELHDQFVVAGLHVPDAETERQIETMLGSVTALFVSPVRRRLLPMLLSSGLRWPKHLSVITTGCGDTIPVLCERPLTYVEVPGERVSVGATRLIVDFFEDSHQMSASPVVTFGRSSMHIRHLDDGSVGEPRKHTAMPSIPDPTAF